MAAVKLSDEALAKLLALNLDRASRTARAGEPSNQD